jgi:hypothetical protein
MRFIDSRGREVREALWVRALVAQPKSGSDGTSAAACAARGHFVERHTSSECRSCTHLVRNQDPTLAPTWANTTVMFDGSTALASDQGPAIGSRTRNVVPAPAVDSKVSDPPCFSTVARATDSP